MTLGAREQAMAALFAIGQSLTWDDPTSGQTMSFSYADRRVKQFADVPTQPALIQAEGDETVTMTTGTPGKQTLRASWVIMHKTALDKSVIAASTNNQILDAAVAALTPVGRDSMANRQTLGGLAFHVWIDGRVFKDAGDLDGQGLIIIPISLLLP